MPSLTFASAGILQDFFLQDSSFAPATVTAVRLSRLSPVSPTVCPTFNLKPCAPTFNLRLNILVAATVAVVRLSVRPLIVLQNAQLKALLYYLNGPSERLAMSIEVEKMLDMCTQMSHMCRICGGLCANKVCRAVGPPPHSYGFKLFNQGRVLVIFLFDFPFASRPRSILF